MNRCSLLATTVALGWIALVPPLQAQEPKADARGYAETSGTQMVAMRDGVRLATDIYLPTSGGPWPTIVRRTPYGRYGGGSSYTRRGFAFAIQDQRGLHDSEGEYRPHENEMDDGYDTIEWIASQPWSNGKIGISGYSALGIAANLAAAADPPHLEAAYVMVAPESLFYEGRFIGGMFKEADSGQWLAARGLDPAAIDEFRNRAVLDQRWLDTDFVFHRHNVDIPIYNVGGWFDLFLKGTIDNFRYLQEWGRPGAKGHQKVLIGPFGHSSVSGSLSYPDGGSWTRTEEELRWFDYWLRGVENGIMEEPPVRWYQTAAALNKATPKNAWRTAEQWPPMGVSRRRLFLHANQLSFEPPVAKESSSDGWSALEFDPEHPIPTLGGLNLVLRIGPMDQREIETSDGYLRLETEPLSTDLFLAGPLKAEIWVSTDAIDADFIVKLVDVYPNGYEALLIDGGLRAKFRHGRRARDVAPMVPGDIQKLEIDLWHTGAVFEKGHRIAVHLASSNYPRFDLNRAGRARSRIYHDRDHPSSLVLPILQDIDRANPKVHKPPAAPKR